MCLVAEERVNKKVKTVFSAYGHCLKNLQDFPGFPSIFIRISLDIFFITHNVFLHILFESFLTCTLNSHVLQYIHYLY